MVTKIKLALALAALLFASSAALAADCLQGTGASNQGQCYPPYVPVDPATGQASGTSAGAPTVATSQATAGTSSTLLCAARTGRRAVTLTNLGTTAVFYGVSGVTTTTGSLLAGTVGATVTLNTSAALFGVVATGSQSVSCTETF